MQYGAMRRKKAPQGAIRSDKARFRGRALGQVDGDDGGPQRVQYGAINRNKSSKGAIRSDKARFRGRALGQVDGDDDGGGAEGRLVQRRVEQACRPQ